MPLTVNVGLSKKIGQPDYGSLGASCHVEVELDSSLVYSDLDGFHQKVKQAFVACSQAVSDELHRQQSASSPAVNGASPQVRSNGEPSRGQATGGRRSEVRKATASQVRAIEAIAGKLQLDLAGWLEQRYGLRLAAELSITQASETIDALKASSQPNGAAHR